MDPAEPATRPRPAGPAFRPEPGPWGPAAYDPRLLAAVPDDVRVRDFGCGDPTPFVAEGEAVLDLGCGPGLCGYIAAQIVGPEGLVLGVDREPAMLDLARRHLDDFAERVGYRNLMFRCGQARDLRLDLEELAMMLAACPVRNLVGYLDLPDVEERLRREDPLVEDGGIDCILANGLLGLLAEAERPAAFAEMARALRPGGRVVACEIVLESAPASAQAAEALRAGASLAGAPVLDDLLWAFAAAGFAEARVVERREPRVEGGLTGVPVTIVATAADPKADRRVAYDGPFLSVTDDQGRTYPKGRPVAVDQATADRLRQPPFAGLFRDA